MNWGVSTDFPASLVVFTEEILHGKLHFLCCVTHGIMGNNTEMKENLAKALVQKRQKHLDKIQARTKLSFYVPKSKSDFFIF